MSHHKNSPENPWAGRFSEERDPLVGRYTTSLHLDRRLAFHDLRGSRAHVRMLAAQGLIDPNDRDRIIEGLDLIEREIRDGSFPFRSELEDIHMNIEVRLQELIGEPGERLHTGRSRNDQVAVDLRLFCLDTAGFWQQQVVEVIGSIQKQAAGRIDELFPAWTHMQAAQPLSWAHYLLAFAEMLRRDHSRLSAFHSLHSVGPLGAGALSGSSLPLDPAQTAAELGFESSFSNSYDVVGDRDCALELSQIAVQIMLHLGRMAEDFIYFSSTPIGWIELPDSLCTGSSMMPQKKNPDLLELLRGKTASVIGHAGGLAVLLKGLPTSYHRDLQQDKEHLFPIVDIVSDSLEVGERLFAGLRIRTDKSESQLSQGFLMATELAEYLVGRGVPFRAAHRRVGELVGHCVERGVELVDLPDEEFARFVPEAGPDYRDVLNPSSVLERRTHAGSTGRAAIQAQLRAWSDWLEAHQAG